MHSTLIKSNLLKRNLFTNQQRLFASSGYHQPERITNQFFIDKDLKYCAHNYKPLPVVLNRGEGIYVWDVEGKKYFDFLCGYSSNNQGHSHPKILKALYEQASKITQTSRAFCNDQMGETCEYLCGVMGYDKFLPMNSGVEGTETSVKLARKWGYTKKGIPENKAQVIVMEGNFWGRTITAAGACDDPSRYTGFGPFTPGFPLVPYDDINAIKKHFEGPEGKNFAAVMVEAIQGERGVIIPRAGYLKELRELCTKHNVLMIIDEVQTGFGRTGKLMGYDWEGIKPDIVAVGKALSGGIMPVSGAFCNDEIMLCIKPGEHGSTFGGNPLAMAVARAAIHTLIDEGMVENALAMGEVMGAELDKIKSPMIIDQRGRGLFRAIEVAHDALVDGSDLAYILMNHGLLTKATHDYSLRLAPALLIKEKQVVEACKVIANGVKDLEKLNNERAKSGYKKPQKH